MTFSLSDSITALVRLALAEDIGRGDITTAATIPKNQQCVFKVIAHQAMCVCGTPLVPILLQEVFGKEIPFTLHVQEGDKVKAGTVLLEGEALAQTILSVERVMLNFLQHLSGVATFTSRYVEAIQGSQAQIFDTRKTIPGLRGLEKYAVKIGGGVNHRLRLDDAVLIKDNHIALNETLSLTVRKAKEYVDDGILIEVECDTLEQVKEALMTEADRIMLDNMSLEDMQKAVKMNAGKKKLEASGNINLDTIEKVAKTGVDYISVGKLTHSAPAVDIGMDIVFLT